MPFWRHYYHIVWATGNREPIIRAEFESVLFDYMMRKAAELDSSVIAINGWFDHVHLVIAIPPKHSVSEVVKLIKGASAHYLNQSLRPEDFFNWQRGYGSLTLGEKQIPIAEAYVRNQKRHHTEQTEIKWLERIDEEDQGPEFKVPGPTRVREAGEAYETWGENPF